MPIQQQKPVNMGFAPVFTSFTMLVLSPIAAIAIIIRNLLKSFKGAIASAGSWNTVVTTDANTKKRTKYGNVFLRLKVDPSVSFSSLPL